MEGGRDESEERLERSVYLDERKMLIEAEWKASEAFDKTMITLCSGALALSLIYIEKIAEHPALNGYLIASWALFIIALLSILIGLRTSEKSMGRQRDILDEAIEMGQKKVNENNSWSSITETLNVISVVGFVLGVACMLLFAYFNPPV